MLNAKVGTKTWSDKPAEVFSKSDGINTMSASDQRMLNQENVGDLLNRVADPNWIDPQKRVRSVGNDKLDKDAFMKLMLAQMKNQDPTNPLKSHEMAAQLAQFTGVEQMMNMNTTLTELKNAQKPAEAFQALNLIGKAVAGDSASVIRAKGDTNHEFAFDLPADAQEVSIKVRSETGDIVRNVSLGNLKKGENRWTWNGQNEQGTSQSTGEYRFLIEAKTAEGKKLNVKTDFQGAISGINFTAEGPVLLVGNQSVKFKDVKKIVDPSLTKNDQNVASSLNPALKAAAPSGQTRIEGAVDPKEGPINNLANVGMSRGLEEKVEKETTVK